MSSTGRRMARSELLKAGAVGAIGLYTAGPALAGRRRKSVTINWLTWQDHYANDQMRAVRSKTGIQARPQLFSDNIDAYVKVKRTGGQYDIVSADALWVPKYLHNGLIESFDLSSIPVSKQLYSIARQLPFWKDGSNYMGYPFGWSTQPLYYNPKYVKTPPTSWHALTEAKYRRKVVLVNAPTDMMACAGLATNARKPYNMSIAEIARAKDYLKAVKPNVLKLVAQSDEAVRALADGSAWIAINNLGTEDRVREAGGPVVKVAIPTEGTVGFIDSEMIVKASKHKDAFEPFINAAEQAPYIARNFIANGRPLFNERSYKILVNQGHGDRARRLLYNQPHKALEMTIKGPSQHEQAYVDAFNEVFGA